MSAIQYCYHAVLQCVVYIGLYATIIFLSSSPIDVLPFADQCVSPTPSVINSSDADTLMGWIAESSLGESNFNAESNSDLTVLANVDPLQFKHRRPTRELFRPMAYIKTLNANTVRPRICIMLKSTCRLTNCEERGLL